MTSISPSHGDRAVAPSASRSAGYKALLRPLLFVFVAAALALAFALLGSEVGEGETRTFDLQMLQLAQALRAAYPGLAEVMRDLSGLGSTVVLTLFTLATVGYLLLVSKKTTALLVAASALSGTVLVSVFKALFGRLRPDAAYAALTASGLSFPSGHASMSALVFLTLGTVIASSRSRLSERAYILLTAILMTLLVGLSRILLGVHYATDVFGGWAFGSAWAMAWLVLARHLGRSQD
ncbi:MAG: phosphatase PAP2 family protein [Rhodoferax sp.]|uniref:phosphatase PAP2 family protein n=1 Tax=Rhodoferax sp. TaxID=50421 RepID=UPI002609F0B9|nr:phosphatase PAP2 family protein [Rhodoferax sp.]MDD5332335.1 phosphatase PAP2 family protein [Rhodoferax sp.]